MRCVAGPVSGCAPALLLSPAGIGQGEGGVIAGMVGVAMPRSAGLVTGSGNHCDPSLNTAGGGHGGGGE